MNTDNVKSATVKKDGRKVKVYKLKSGGWNIFFGDDISLTKIDNKEHQETFKDDELVFDN